MSCRVLIVDDTLIMRQRIGAIAEKVGLGRSPAWLETAWRPWSLRGNTARIWSRLDIVMPKMDGVAALEKQSWRKIPINAS